MAKQVINIGSVANDGTGDPLRTAFDKVNDNFTELYNDDAGDVNSVTGSGGLTASPTTGAVVVNLDDDSITYAKLGVEFTSTEALGSVSTTATLDFATDQVFTATMTANTTFSFSNANIGMTKDLILTGSFDPTFPAGTKQIAGTYDGSVSNFIQIVAVANGDYWLSVSQEQA
jgi:hypothetical protein